jgi:hypothetical protein
MSVADVARVHREPLAGYRLVSVRRNPYERIISFLNMRQGFAAYGGAGEIRGHLDRMAQQLDRIVAKGRLSSLRSDEMAGAADATLDIRILHYETLQADFDAFLHECGVAHPVALPFAKRGLMSQGLDPRRILRRDQIDLINTTFADEFEAGGYRAV